MNQNHSLDETVGVDHIDWKQWLPAIGLVQVCFDYRRGKETFLDSEKPPIFYGSAVVHALGIAGLVYAISEYLS